jgi:S-adenosylmethionine:tRNA ribosyltransferase-isomerase
MLKLDTLTFHLPPELEASTPPEARGLRRDEVRLLVSYLSDNNIVHSRFEHLPEFLTAGDVLVINTSGTLNAALPATRSDHTSIELHLSTHLPGDVWLVELRTPGNKGTQPFYQAIGGEVLTLPAGGSIQLLRPHTPDRITPSNGAPVGSARLWLATLQLPLPLLDYLMRYGFPIRYSYVKDFWPLPYYQTVYATEPGSAEMPSAGRAFTPELITQLIAQGVQFAPLILHTGVASLEKHEPPYEEYYRVPLETARIINLARESGKRVIAVGTTCIRAVETLTDPHGSVRAGEGWTNLVITPQRGIQAVSGLLTGWHEPQATHLAMLEALAGREHLQRAYSAALQEHYLWHEFGDLHLILP